MSCMMDSSQLNTRLLLLPHVLASSDPWATRRAPDRSRIKKAASLLACSPVSSSASRICMYVSLRAMRLVLTQTWARLYGCMREAVHSPPDDPRGV
jgi:hypothetical protein